jgi:hypothetical protein
MNAERTQAADADRVKSELEKRLGPIIEALDDLGVRRVLRVGARVSAAAVLALFAFGTVMMATMLRPRYVAAGVLVLAAVPWLFESPAKRWRAVHVAVITPIAIAVPIVALLGVDVLWSSARFPRPSPRFGLAVAGAVIAAMAYAYLRWVGKPPPTHHRHWALYAGAVALALVALTGQHLPGIKLAMVALAVSVATWIYLEREAGPDIKHPLWWALLLVAVGVIAAPLLAEAIQGRRTSPILLIAAAVIATIVGFNGLWLPAATKDRRHARRVLGAVVVFGIAVPLGAFAFIKVTSSAPAAPNEKSLPVAAASGPLAQAALDHRPILLFDTDERFRTPLDVDAMLKSGHVQLCPEGKGLLTDCRNVSGVTDLRNGFGNLRFDTQTIEDDELPTTIYAHTVRDALHTGWTDIDYWWYLPDNPANTAQGAMCGAGLVIPEITCFDHQSDWEGVTVVVDEAQNPVAVHYAAHDHVIEVAWSTLQAAVGTTLRPYAAHRDVANRPLVFVARGTHAAYPLPCKSSTCNGNSTFEDNRHDGHHAWPEEPCSGEKCVTAFPRTAANAADASWNAFDGHWGSAVCVAKVYCARSNAPAAPGTQGRYQRPWCYDYATGSDLRHPHAVDPPPHGCEKKTKD